MADFKRTPTDEIRQKLSDLARDLLDADQYAIVVVTDKDKTSYCTENFDPSVLPAALRELADKADVNLGRRHKA